MHSRHLTLGSLALVALLGAGSGLVPAAAATPSAPTVAGGAPDCGRPEIPAQWGSIEHPAVTRVVDAVTRTEWRWQRSIGTVEREYARESVAPVDLLHWTRSVDVVEETDLPVGEQPAGEGWVAGATAEISAAEEERVWLPDGAVPDAGFVATGATRAGTPRLESTAVTSVRPPVGDGWTALPGSAVDVVVTAARELVVEPAWVEDFVVAAGQPATPPCAAPHDGA
jgi:hypothetical protein